MIKLKYNIQARTNVIQDSYFTIEKINLMLKDYTIDYEEYFNRKNVWCNNYTQPFTRDVGTGGYCTIFTAYGNNNAIELATASKRKIYFCSSNTITDPYDPQTIIYNTNIQNGLGCQRTGQQSFGQYYWQFRDVKKDVDVDSVPGAWNDYDDESIMRWPSAIEDPANVKELYLISQDDKSRILIRRALIESGDWNHNGITGDNDSEKRYTLQILKLRGFDAGNNHDFNITNSSWVYDGKIDTRTCDYAQWFICSWTEINNTIYPWYKVPSDQNDGRVNLFQKNITISNRNLIIYPTKNPQYALAESNVQINPYFTINLTSKLYGEIRQKKLGIQNIDTFQISLQTTFNTKNFYTK